MKINYLDIKHFIDNNKNELKELREIQSKRINEELDQLKEIQEQQIKIKKRIDELINETKM